MSQEASANVSHSGGRTPLLLGAAIYVGMVAGQVVHQRTHPTASVNLYLGVFAAAVVMLAWRRPRTLPLGVEAALLLGVVGVVFAYFARPH